MPSKFTTRSHILRHTTRQRLCFVLPRNVRALTWSFSYESGLSLDRPGSTTLNCGQIHGYGYPYELGRGVKLSLNNDHLLSCKQIEFAHSFLLNCLLSLHRVAESFGAHPLSEIGSPDPLIEGAHVSQGWICFPPTRRGSFPALTFSWRFLCANRIFCRAMALPFLGERPLAFEPNQENKSSAVAGCFHWAEQGLVFAERHDDYSDWPITRYGPYPLVLRGPLNESPVSSRGGHADN